MGCDCIFDKSLNSKVNLFCKEHVSDSKNGVGCFMGSSPQFKHVECSSHVLATFSCLTHLHRCGPYNNIRDRSVYSYIDLPLFSLYNVNQCDFDVQFLCGSFAERELETSRCVKSVLTESCDIAEKCANKKEDVNLTSIHTNKQLCFDYTLGFVTQPSSLSIVSHSSPWICLIVNNL